MEMKVSNWKVIAFTPDRWGTLERFQHFYAATYTFDTDTQKALPGAANHLNKALILLQIARQHAAKLPEDRAQLREHGCTSAQRGRELSALIESVLLDLYSSVDCTRKVVTFLYQKPFSTHEFYKNNIIIITYRAVKPFGSAPDPAANLLIQR